VEKSEKKTLIAALTKSPHGDLAEYIVTAGHVLEEDADFFGHLIAWNAIKGEVRDAQIALPLLALSDPNRDQHEDLIENAVAHLADLSPRMFLKALEFGRDVRKGFPFRIAEAAKAKTKTSRAMRGVSARAAIPARSIRSTLIRRLVRRYLKDLEADRNAWEGTAVRHRNRLKALYAWYSEKPGEHADRILFKRNPSGGPFLAIKTLSKVSPEEAAGAILKYKLPFLTIRGAAGKNVKDPSVVMAMLKTATPTELVTNAKAFERLGVKDVPALRAAFEEALERAGKKRSKSTATLKTTRAAEAMEEGGETKIAGKLRALQEKQLDNLRGIDGDWLVIADKSSSMSTAIDLARAVSATLARMIKGAVHLTFCDESVRYFEATGKSYEELKALTKGVMANGGTCLGGGLQYIIDRKIAVDGIVIVSDGGENRVPYFASTYESYKRTFDEPTVYFYQVTGDPDGLSRNCQLAKIDLQTFDLRGQKVDQYSLPNLVQTMRVGRYSLVDEVYNTPLMTLDEVLERTKGMPVVRRSTAYQKV
jgi:hypothetical protein